MSAFLKLFLLALVGAYAAPVEALEILQANGDASTESTTRVRLGEGDFTVRLAGGKDKADRESIATEYLSIRAEKGHDAVVKLESGKRHCSVYVVEGICIIRNELDRSVLKVMTGTTYETTKKLENCQDFIKHFRSDLPKGTKRLPLFDTKVSTTTLFIAPKSRSCQMISPPTLMNYSIGLSAENSVPIPPDLVAHFPPSGVIAEEGESVASRP